MSRKTLKRRLIIAVDSKLESQSKLIKSKDFLRYLSSNNTKEKEFVTENLRTYVSLQDLLSVLETDDYDPFMLVSNGETSYVLDDSEIDILERDLDTLITNIISKKSSVNINILKPEIIKTEYISPMQRIVYKRYH